MARANLPYLALPFNMIIVCTFLTIQPRNPLGDDLDLPESDLDLAETTTILPSEVESPIAGNETVKWCQVWRGVLVSMSQVYGINDVASSIVMNIAVALASPLLFITCTIGAIIGSLLGQISEFIFFVARRSNLLCCILVTDSY